VKIARACAVWAQLHLVARALTFPAQVSPVLKVDYIYSLTNSMAMSSGLERVLVVARMDNLIILGLAG
jgi:hypothetical protein